MYRLTNSTKAKKFYRISFGRLPFHIKYELPYKSTNLYKNSRSGVRRNLDLLTSFYDNLRLCSEFCSHSRVIVLCVTTLVAENVRDAGERDLPRRRETSASRQTASHAGRGNKKTDNKNERVANIQRASCVELESVNGVWSKDTPSDIPVLFRVG